MVVINTATYKLIDSYNTTNFFNQFEFLHDTECVSSSFSNFMRNISQAQQLGIINITNNSIYIGTDYWNIVGDEGRASVCIGTKSKYKQGLFILDASHMPFGCGVWPSWWMTDGTWYPNILEFDTIEGINLQINDYSTLHSQDDKCNFKSFALNTSYNQQFMTGKWDFPNATCNDNPACAVSPQNSSSNNYGNLFNINNGGVYATQIYINDDYTSGYLKTYFWSRNDIPIDIINKTPDPLTWKLPYGYYPFNNDNCNVANIDTYLQLRFDLYYCGWSGNDPTWKSQCSSTNIAKNQTCKEFVANNPNYFKDGYWLINYMDIYQVKEKITKHQKDL